MITTAVVLALIAAVSLAFATHLQQHAVASQPAGRRRRLTWLAGLGLMIAVTVLNVLALGLGPVTIVQPIGALSLVVAVLISVRVYALHVDRRLLASIGLTLASITVFVAASARVSTPLALGPGAVSGLLVVLLALAVLAAGIALSRAGHLTRVAVTGVVFGAVAASAHVLATSVLAGGLPGLVLFGGMWWLLVMLLALAAAAGFWLVQTAYATGPAETVLAGLTVIDPIVAVVIGAVLFGEYAGLSLAAGVVLALAAAGGIWGVRLLAAVHPRTLETSLHHPPTRAHAGAGTVSARPAARRSERVIVGLLAEEARP